MNKPDIDTTLSNGGFPFPIPAWQTFGTTSGPLAEWMGCFSRLQTEVVTFAQARFRRDVDAMEHFARCRKPEEYVDAQATFLAQAYSDYAKENLKIAEMLGEAMQRTREKVAEAGIRSP